MRKNPVPNEVRNPRTRIGILPLILAAALAAHGQPARGANKFLGCVPTLGRIPADFNAYWNQITPEYETQWGSVEGNRDQMDWSGADRVAGYARAAGIPWKFHSLVYGRQYPNWISGLSHTQQRAEIEQWFDEAKKKYPDLVLIDVVSGGQWNHDPPPFLASLGNVGGPSNDWIFDVFRMARERWPKAILIYDDYENLEFADVVDWTVALAKAAIKAKVPIDAIGCQAHQAYQFSTDTVKSNLDKLAATGLPIFITEYEIGGSDDSGQLQRIQDHFPVLWNHPSVVGVTFGGYIVGQTWRNGTGLVSDAGVERPALTWLKGYVKDNPSPPNRFPDLLGRVTGIHTPRIFRDPGLRTADKGRMRIFDLNGREIPNKLGAGWERPEAAIAHFPMP
jgi:endo-1,4-beta-xylanase